VRAYEALARGGEAVGARLGHVDFAGGDAGAAPATPGQDPVRALTRALRRADSAVAATLAGMGWSLADVQSVSPGHALPLLDSLQRLAARPPQALAPRAYALMGRMDVAATVWAGPPAAPGRRGAGARGPAGAAPALAAALARVREESAEMDPRGVDLAQGRGAPGSPPPGRGAPGAAAEAPALGRAPGGAPVTGLEGLLSGEGLMRFPSDARLGEACRLLDTSAPKLIKLPRPPESTGDAELDVQYTLWAMARRTLATPVGRGALTLHTVSPSPSEVVAVPELVISGRLASQKGAVVSLDVGSGMQVNNMQSSAVVTLLTEWPLFHNGCAAGLRVRPGRSAMSRTWVNYHTPQEPTPGHAGMLLAMGLSGHLASLSIQDLYEMLR